MSGTVHRAVKAAAVTLAALAFTGCGATQGPAPDVMPTGNASPTGSPSPTEPVEPSKPPVASHMKGVSVTPACPEGSSPKPFKGGEAVKVFGAKRVMDAYCEIAGFYLSDVAALFPKSANWNEVKFNEWDKRVGPLMRGDYDDKIDAFLMNPENAPTPFGPVNVDPGVLGVEFRGNQIEHINPHASKATPSLVNVSGKDYLNLKFTVYNHYVVYKPASDTKHVLGVPMSVSIDVHEATNPIDRDHEWVTKGLRYEWKGTGPVTLDKYMANPEVLKSKKTAR